jgi:hypothetical protein
MRFTKGDEKTFCPHPLSHGSVVLPFVIPTERSVVERSAVFLLDNPP